LKQKIAVIGAGVIGLSVARNLALQGASVTLLEAATVGSGTSATSYAWVNSNGKSPDAYHALNVAGMNAHRLLQQQSQSQIRWLDECGTLEWAAEPSEVARLQKRVESLIAKGYAAIPVSLPELILPAESVPIWSFPDESLLCPALFVAFLRSEAIQNGVTLLEHQRVTEIDEQASGVRLQLSNGSCWEGDIAVSAVGRWSASLLATVGVELAMVDADQPGHIGCSFLGHTSPAQIQLRANLITPDINIRPDGGGRLLLQVLDIDHQADPKHVPAVDGPVGREMMARLARVMRNSAGVQLEQIVVGQRSRPADGLPAVGYVTDRKRVYVVATHSGMTLAPALGNLVAEDILTGSRPALLAEFSPERLIGRKASEFQEIETHHFPAAQ
jgi:glycine/D-amino acid oxidase-like deaminating enzyme